MNMPSFWKQSGIQIICFVPSHLSTQASYAVSSVNIDLFTDAWKPVKRGKIFPVSLENSYLHVKTNSKVGSFASTTIMYYGKDGKVAGGFETYFVHPRVAQRVSYCQASYEDFPVALPSQLEKVWTIEKRGYTTRVFCNKALILKVTVSNATCSSIYSDWETFWSREVHGIKFVMKTFRDDRDRYWADSASEKYRIG
jgi:hypothetical protein